VENDVGRDERTQRFVVVACACVVERTDDFSLRRVLVVLHPRRIQRIGVAVKKGKRYA
jgi:hypothetical protein